MKNCLDCNVAIHRAQLRCKFCNQNFKHICPKCNKEFLGFRYQVYCGSRRQKVGCAWTKHKNNPNRANGIKIAKAKKPALYKAIRQKSALKHPEAVRKAHLRNKHQRSIIVGSHTETEWLQLKTSFGQRCALCDISERLLATRSPKHPKLTRDHIIPVSRGGTDYIENIRPLCISCNSRKGAKITSVIYCCGVFDLIHVGHIKLLQNAKDLGDHLIVGVVSDKAVRRQKGEDRPVVIYEHRAELVRAMKGVGRVMLQEDFDPTDNLRYLISKGMPIDVFALGADQSHINIDFVRSNNIKIITLQRTPEVSTSKIVEKLKASGS